MTAARTAASRAGKAGIWVGFLLILKFVVLWLSDAVFAPPIIAITAWLGFWPAFTVCSVLYALGSWVLTLGALRLVSASARNPAGRFTRRIGAPFLKRFWKEDRSEFGLALREWLRRDPGIALTISSVLIGGVITTLFWRRIHRNPYRVAIYANVVFGISFAFTYAGGFTLIKSIF